MKIEKNNLKMNKYLIKDVIKNNEKSKIKAGDGLLFKKLTLTPFFDCGKFLKKEINITLVSKENIFMSTGGKANIHYYNGNASYSTDVFSFKSNNNDIINKYLYFYLLSQNKEIESFFRGSGLKHLNKKDFFKMELFIPQKKEQQKISHLLSLQEKQIETIQELIEKLEIRNQYYAEKLLSGELRIKKDDDGNINLYENEEWEGVVLNGKDKEIPIGWNKIDNNKAYKEFSKSKIKAGDAKKDGENKIYPFFNCSKKQSLMYSDFLIDDEVVYFNTGGAPAVHYYNGKSSYSTDVWALHANQNLILNKYFYYYFFSNITMLENIFQGAVIKHLNKKDFKKMEIFFPEINEQKNIINFLDMLYKEKETAEILLEKEQLRFQWMLDNLLSGEYQVVDEED